MTDSDVTINNARAWAEMMASAERQFNHQEGWAYAGPASYVLANGREFTGRPLPRGIKRGTPKQCFKNATDLVLMHPTWHYVEGYVWSVTCPIGIEHAWAIDEQGEVVDNTLRATEQSNYFGVVYDRDTYLRYVARTSYYGVMGGDYRAAIEVVKTGSLPDPS